MSNNISYTHVYLEVHSALNSTQKFIPRLIECTWRNDFAKIGATPPIPKVKSRHGQTLVSNKKTKTKKVKSRAKHKKTFLKQKNFSETKKKKVRAKHKKLF